MKNSFNTGIIFFILLYGNASLAGGPLVIEGPKGNTPVSYQDANITLDVENGALGALSNAGANNLMQQALDLWNGVATSKLNLSLVNSINLDINSSNYDTYIPDSNTDKYNPIIYDDDGKIIDDFFGEQSNTVLGFAASSVFVGSSYFEEGFMVINGSIDISDTDYELLLAHEIGHFFGLDHSQTNVDNEDSSCRGFIDYPVMYPSACRNVGSLHSDDISAVSALYPDTNIDDNLGILKGRLLTDIGNALLGANIWVENVSTGETYSIVSDYLLEGTGFYKLHLPAGNYTLHANSINTEFVMGSGVGPYSTSLDDISFTEPHPITPFTYQDDIGKDEIITIEVNRTLTVDFNSVDISPPPPEKESSRLTTIPFTLLLILTILQLRGREKS